MINNLTIENLLSEATVLKASDIHFQPLPDKVNVYFRIKNKIHLRTSFTTSEYEIYKRIIKYWSKMEITISDVPQDSSFTFIGNDQKKFHIRVSNIPLLKNETIVLRIIYDDLIYSFQELSNQSNHLNNIYETILFQKGLYIITGSTGSGKTTTMYGILNKLATCENKKVITVENPIEVNIENLVQTQINDEKNLGYSTYFKAVLRQDPDYIMVGEIRDLETAKVVIQAALTGHTVISTIHSNDLAGVVRRFLDFGFLLSEIEAVLIGITRQELKTENNKTICQYNSIFGDELKKLILGFKND